MKQTEKLEKKGRTQGTARFHKLRAAWCPKTFSNYKSVRRVGSKSCQKKS